MKQQPVLAVYDFRSKQEYIYRTNRMREITGASEIIATAYQLLFEGATGSTIRNDWRESTEPLFNEQGEPMLAEGEAGVVVYEGGGNLLVLYRDRDAYVQANKEFSRTLAERASTLCLVTACAEWDPKKSLDQNKSRAFAAFDAKKRMGHASVPCNVLPYTQVDATTFMPIVGEMPFREEGTGKIISIEQITQEGQNKLDKFNSMSKERKTSGKHIDDLGLKKGDDSLIAVLYFDGNSIGEKVKAATASRGSKDQELDAMRRFSVSLHEDLVKETEQAMKEAIEQVDKEYGGYRVIIDHGDEITFVCNAHTAPLALRAYFDALATSSRGYQACGGMAFCHAHDPFAMVYDLAEQCCEAGKHRNRMEQAAGAADASYVDFHFVRSGITGSLKQIRKAQERGNNVRPYRLDEFDLFLDAGRLLAAESCKLKRSDLKALNRAILRGMSAFLIELKRLEAKDKTTVQRLRDLVESKLSPEGLGAAHVQDEEALRLILHDVTEYWDVFDLAFGTAKRGEDDE